MKAFKDIQTQGDFNPFFVGASANWPTQKEEYKLPKPSLQSFHLKRNGASEPRRLINWLSASLSIAVPALGGNEWTHFETTICTAPPAMFKTLLSQKDLQINRATVQTCSASASANKSAMSNIVHVLFSLLLGSTKLFGLVLHVPHYVLEAL